MEIWQKSVLIFFIILNLWACIKGYFESKRGKVYNDTIFLYPLGIFVWGDAIVFGLFWVGASTIFLILNDWVLFLLTASIFWLVRSMGEANYWINQQYSKVVRNPPEKMRFYFLFKNDSVWFAYQIFWQCVMVMSIITSIYLGNMWLK